FEQRRRAGQGYAIDGIALERHPSMTSIMREIPHLLVTTAGPGDYRVLARQTSASTSRGFCEAAIYVDGFRTAAQAIQLYHPAELAAVETFIDGHDAPLKYQQSGSACAVILIWTRGTVR
ncbi:MAG: hypothetical protein M3081_08645, partial [Gemmatimonadota bacterium]|nr:hypothetical protein [Gemmatimonadota bacterium]